MSRYGRSPVTVSFGPGPITPAVRAIIIANVAVFLVSLVAWEPIATWFGLSPQAVFEQGRVWQLATFMFVHAGPMHILFNMLTVWMFGVDLERRWGTREFTKYYFLTGVGAGLSMILVSLLPFAAARATYDDVTVGASGAAYGLIVAWALVFPTRQILFLFLFPLQARVFGLIMVALVLYQAIQTPGGPVAHMAHLGGIIAGVVYLKGPTNLRLELRYRLTKWRMERMRRKFNLHKGGRGNWGDRIH